MSYISPIYRRCSCCHREIHPRVFVRHAKACARKAREAARKEAAKRGFKAFL